MNAETTMLTSEATHATQTVRDIEASGTSAANETAQEGRDQKRLEKKKLKEKGDEGPYLPFKIASAVPISPDTKLFRLQAPPEHAHLLRNLPGPVGHIRVKATLPPLPHDPTTTELVKRRPYTVLRRFPAPDKTSPEDDHHIEVMIKRYNSFGLSDLLHSRKEGDTVELQLSDRDKHARVNLPEIHLRHKRIGIVTAGTALAPMISVMRSVLYNAEANDTNLTLLYANRHEEDILLRKELEELWEAHPSRLTIYFLLSQPRSESWGPHTSPYQLRGRITRGMLEQVLPLPVDTSSSEPRTEADRNDPFVLVCGPKPFKKLALQFLEELHFQPNMYYKL